MKLTLFTLIFVLTSCSTLTSLVHRHQEFHISTVNNNVCKRLSGDVVLYAIFVDSKYTNTWSEYDIRSTIDSIELATSWIEEKAKASGVPLRIKVDYHQDSKGVIPINGNLARKTLTQTALAVGGVKNVDRWADKIGKEALRAYGPDTSVITKTKIRPFDRERLIARLRDIHGTDNVALMYFINNYYTNEISLALHTGSHDNPEYAVVSYKTPAVIAHEFLHIFGALDLYITPFDKKKKAVKQKAFAMKEFPNEIMAFAYRGLDSLDISPFTKYLIGWERELDDRYKQMIIGKKVKVASY